MAEANDNMNAKEMRRNRRCLHQDLLRDDLRKTIDLYCARYDYSYTEIVGALEIVKHDMLMEDLTREDDDGQ